MNSADPTHPVPVAIIGMGCLFPKAEDLTSYWANIRNRLDAITEVPETHWRPEDYFDDDPKAPDRTYARRGGFLSPVDFPALEFGIAPHNLDATDTTQLLGLMVARQALEDAGYGPGRDFERDRVSVILGVTGTLELVIPLGARLGHPIWRRALEAAGVEETKAEEVVRRISGSYVGWQENSFPGLLGNVAAGRIANRLDLGGTNCVIDAACASSLGAVHLAMLELASGRCDLALTGGLDTFNDIFMYLCFSKTPALSPTGDARPFDADGDGTILGEGLGVLALKRRDDAIRDGDRIYAVIRGVGTSSDGKGSAVYAPSAAGQAEALRRAYAVSGVSPDTIELVEAHGTGTKVGDATELAALGAVYREAKPEGTWCALGSVKSQIGHTKAAAGAAGLIKAALALHHKVLPPTIKVERPIEPAASGAAPFYINTESRPWLPRPDHPRRAAVSAFGFGGSNFHCVLEEADAAKAAIDWDGATQIVAFSAPSREALRAALDAWPRDPTWNALRAEAARARARFRVEEPVRLLLVVERAAADLARVLDRAGALIASGPNRAVVGPSDGIYLGIGPKPGGLAMLFPGQGSQYVGMLRDLACQFPAMHDALAEADGAVGDDGPRPSDRIYPRPAFTESERARQEQALRATEVAQPALGAVSLGVLAILEHFGVRPDALAGHSFGELTALGASGRFDARALALLALRRGRLMARRAGDRGAMLAVLAPLDRVESALRDGGLDLVVANKNAPQQAVLSGPADEVARAAALFEGRGIATRRLDVSAAFHSRFVAEVREPFHEALRAVAFAPARLPVYANTTAARYPDDPDQARALLAGQLAQPVEFVAEVEAMYRSGLRTFLEVGPDAKLTGLVGAILDGREHAALAVDASRGRRGNVFDLARALAQLAALGHPVHLPGWDDAADARAATVRAPGLTVKICGANAKPRSAPTPVLEPPTAMTTTPPNRSSESHVPATNGDQAAHPGRNGTSSDHPRNSSGGTPTPVEPRPAIAPTPLIPPLPQGDPARLTQALRTIQENLIGLQKLGEQTARLHRQFLDGQDRTQHTFQALLEQQQRLTLASLGQEVAVPPSSPTTPRAHPSPTRETASEPEAPRSSPPAAPAAQVSPPPPPPRAIPEPPAPAAAPAPAPPAPSAIECTQAALLDVVAEKTGYPAEMLEPDMQLDADLGIDSIKRVEILSALQERLPDAPVIKPEHLGTLRTLRQIIGFLSRGAAPAAPSPSPAEPPPAAPSAGPVHDVLLEIVAEKTGYPAEMLEPDMQLDADLGIDSIKRVEILSALQERLPDAPVIKPEHLGTLRTLRQIIEFLNRSDRPAVAVVPAPATTVAPASSPGPESAAPLSVRRLIPTSVALDERARREPVAIRAGGEVWIAEDDSDLPRALANRLEAMSYQARVIRRDEIARLEAPARLDGLVLPATMSGTDDAAIKGAFRLLRTAGTGLRRAGRETGAVLATVSRLDGSFGLRGLPPHAEPTSGGLAGLAKTAGHEWSEVHCKAIDLDPGIEGSDQAAAAIVEEMFRRGPAEVGIARAGRFRLELSPAALNGDGRIPPLEPGDLVVITGGARGITAEVAIALADAFRPTLLVLGRSPEPTREPDWLAPLRDEAEIKRALLARADGQATPRAIAEQSRQVAANREVLRNLERIEAAGAHVIYRPADVRDEEAVRRRLDEARAGFGPIRGLIHGAGVLADRRIEEKDDEQFAAVYDTKVAGLRALLRSLGPDALRVLVLFSSSTARFGRKGQVAYAAANEVLNKWAQREARRRPACRVVSVNWGPWDGGMVTSSLKPIFEAEGIALIPPRDGARYLVEEIQTAADHRPVEVVVLGDRPEPDGPKPRPRSAPKAAPALTTIFERTLDVTTLPVLRSHVIDGRPVVPMVLTLEWLAHGALHRNPGLLFHGIDEFRVLKGVILRDGRPETVRVLAGKAAREDGLYRVPVELRGTSGDGREFAHARGEVVLADRYPQARPAIDLAGLRPYPADPGTFYRAVLFHGPDLQGIDRVEGCGPSGIAGVASTAPSPSAWIVRPLRQAWLADPLALDCAFQMVVLWGVDRHGSGSLPTSLGRYRQFRRAFPAGQVRIAAQVTQAREHRALADIEFLDADGQLVARIEDYECVIDASLNQAFRHNRLVQVAHGSGGV